jgi:hypothetical protein
MHPIRTMEEEISLRPLNWFAGILCVLIGIGLVYRWAVTPTVEVYPCGYEVTCDRFRTRCHHCERFRMMYALQWIAMVSDLHSLQSSDLPTTPGMTDPSGILTYELIGSDKYEFTIPEASTDRFEARNKSGTRIVLIPPRQFFVFENDLLVTRSEW